MPAPRDPASLMRAAHLYYVEGRSQADVAARWAPAAPTCRGCSRRRNGRGSSRSGSTTRPAACASSRGSCRRASASPRSASLPAARCRPPGSRSGWARWPRACCSAASRSRPRSRCPGAALSRRRCTPSSPEQDHDVTLVQLLGGVSATSHEISGQELVRELAVRLGASYQLLHAPAALESSDACRSLLPSRRSPRRSTVRGHPTWRSSASATRTWGRRRPSCRR